MDDGVYEPVNQKLEVLIQHAHCTLAEAAAIEEKLKSAEKTQYAALWQERKRKVELANTQIDQAELWLMEISKMRAGSVAKVDQITTISKMRITQPLQKFHPLYGVRLSA